MNSKTALTTMFLSLLLIFSGVTVASRTWAHSGEKKPSGMAMGSMDHGKPGSSKNASWTTVKLKGEIIDLGCYVSHDGYGKKHKTCALECSKNGVPLAFLENKTKKVYMIVTTGHGENPYAVPIKYVADQVEVEGATAVKDGATVLMITSIKKVGV